MFIYFKVTLKKRLNINHSSNCISHMHSFSGELFFFFFLSSHQQLSSRLKTELYSSQITIPDGKAAI